MAKKRPSLFAPPVDPVQADPTAHEPVQPTPLVPLPVVAVQATKRPPSREGKRILSVYLDPVAWKQLRQLALDSDTTTQALGEEAINLLFTSRGLNRSA